MPVLIFFLALLATAGAGAQSLDLFDLPALKDYKALRVSSNNPDPGSNDDSKRPIAGETLVMADLKGPGIVTHIWITVAASEYGWPRLLRFRVYYDGSDTPSVDAPLGDFFAVGHGFERNVNSLMVRNSSSGRSRNCYWPMPFRDSCRITVTNEGRRRVSNFYYHVDWRKMAALPAGRGYFHARYRQELPAASGKLYSILNVAGRGHYVGTVFNVIQNEPGWFGEGDEWIYVDGEKTASTEGTGTEDYFNDAWSLRVSEGLYTGVPVAEGTSLGSRMSAYRWHLLDPLPFTRSLRFDIEHAGWTFNPDGKARSAFEERADLFSSVAFWYQQGIAKGLAEPPYGSARLPHGNARQVEVEDFLGEVKTEGGRATRQNEVFWGKDLLVFRAEKPGARIDIPLEVEEDGHYELVAQLAHAPDYGMYRALVDGKLVGPRGELEHEPGANLGGAGAMDAYHTELYVAADHLVGWPRLAKGRHTVSFVAVGKNERSRGYLLGIDTLVLARVGAPAPASASAAALRRLGEQGPKAAASLPRIEKALAGPDSEARQAAAWTLTQMGPAAAPALKGLTRALDDPDHVVRGLSAAALRNLGPAARPALSALVARLEDPEAGVRMTAADALAALGPAVVEAIPALIAACQAEGQHVHVLRSAAAALGAAGPAAAAAVPTLKKLEAIPRVRWPASSAIRKITGGR